MDLVVAVYKRPNLTDTIVNFGAGNELTVQESPDDILTKHTVMVH
jgi:hypothetical protein